ncbi:hypothetical protein FQN50_004691 [Emmonsiellopsis sp. PD_5]|nr:hypothetical protein FQN50_004691 [Emmonsiellopsis sp. PD_5]
MAMKYFKGRQRANTGGDTISRPTLTHTDALPRSDLQPLGQVSGNVTEPRRSNTFDSHSRQQPEEWRAPPAFDFQISPAAERPPSPETHSRSGSDEQTMMIGIALGSPTLQRNPQPAQPFPFPLEDPMVDVHDADAEKSKPKPSKWKKIGGLFKSKNLPPPPNEPFYQLDQPAASHRDRITPPASHETSHAPPPWDNVPPQSSKVEDDDAKLAKRKMSKKAAKHSESPKHRKKPVREAEDIQRPSTSAADDPASSESPSLVAPYLSVDIPDVQMERYSVMFGSLLGKPPSSTLLARRSKVLDKLKTYDEEEDPEQAQMPLPRRATSPVPTRSPKLTLFPAPPGAKPSKLLAPYNPNFPRPQMPLQRANTAPPSPRRVGNEDSAPVKEVTAQSGTPATSSSARSQWASEGSSFLSTASSSSKSSTSSNEDDTVVLQIKRIDTSTHEPVWEILNPEAKVEPASSKSKLPRKKLQKTQSEEAIAATTEKSPKPSRKRTEAAEPRAPVPAHAVKPEARLLQPFVDQWMPDPPPPPPPQRKPPPTPAPPPSATTPQPNPTITASPSAAPLTIPRSRSRSASKSRSPPRIHINAHPEDDTNPVEVSVARSVSVSKRPKQVIVPISAMRTDSLRSSSEKFGLKRTGTPTLISPPRGHKHEKSQEVPIEIA